MFDKVGKRHDALVRHGYTGIGILSRMDKMAPTVIPAVILIVITIAASMSLRHWSRRIRAGFDLICFVILSIYLDRQDVFPIFAAPHGHLSSGEIAIRFVGGAWWVLGARLVVSLLWFALHRDQRSREARLFSDLTATAIYIVTGIVVMDSVFALSVTGVVATSGVVAIFIGLALQNTLADVFAGIAVGIEAPFSVDDRVKIGDMLEGQIVQVNWRSIRIHTDDDDIVTIPNSIVAKAEIINRSYPSLRRAASVDVWCPASALPERVIETLLNATLLCPDILHKPAPGAVMVQFGRRNTLYRVSFHVAGTLSIASTKDTLLRAARRQLLYAGFLDEVVPMTAPRDPSSNAVMTMPHKLLRDLLLFESLTDAQVEKLAEKLIPRHLEPNEKLFTEAEVETSLNVIASGIIEITREEKGNRETIGCIGAGEYVGEIGLLTGTPHAATATARTHCQVYKLPHEAIAPLMKTDDGLLVALDKSARRGLDMLHRNVAARTARDIGAPGQLLSRIRRFFGLTAF